MHGNLLIGPTAIDIDDKEGTNTTRDGLDQVLEKSARNVKDIPYRKVITSFAGLRAHGDGHDFIIGEVHDAPGFIDCAGIESPGLTSSPAIGEMIAGIIRDILHPEEKKNFIEPRKGILNPSELTREERIALIHKNPAYGNIICRCGFCTPRTMEILARELHVDQSEITKSGGNSKLIVGINKDSIRTEDGTEDRIKTDSTEGRN